jgi:hypothetical protein
MTVVCDALLSFPLPLESHVVRAVQTVGGEAPGLPVLLNHLLGVMVMGPLFEEPKFRGSLNVYK